MVVYEWADAEYLGKVTSPADALLPVSGHTCITSALRSHLVLNKAA